MSIAINPTNPNNLVAVCHSPTFLTLNTFFSLDGGITWTQRRLGYLSGPDQDGDGQPAVYRFDPTVAFDSSGNVYVAYGAGGPNDPPNTRVLIVAKSSMLGAGYSQITVVDGPDCTLDKWVICTGRDPLNAAQQNVYVAYDIEVNDDQQVRLAASYDGGLTFPVNTLVNDDSIGIAIDRTLFAMPAVAADGRLYVVWIDYNDYPHHVAIKIANSIDAGMSFGPSGIVQFSSVYSPGTPKPLSYYIFAQPDRGITACPSIAINRTSGRIYVAYTELNSDGGRIDPDVWVAFTDNPNPSLPGHWTNVRVNNWDGGDTDQFHPWVNVDQGTGDISVVWYDTRRDPSHKKVDCYHAVSFDGGNEWAEQRVSVGQSDQSTDNGSRWVNNFLEYIGVGTRNRIAHPLWADNSNNLANLDVYTDAISLEPGACCTPFGECLENQTQGSCLEIGGIWLGAGSSCSGLFGACCFGGFCQELAQECCQVMGGTFYGGNCLPAQGCCLDDGDCENASETCCVPELGGILQGAGTTCTMEQACCLADHTCIMIDPLCCDEAGGIAQGAFTVCNPPLLFEACCLTDGTCRMLDPLCCNEAGGTAQGPGSTCGQLRACCLANGDCVMVAEVCCDDLGGTLQDVGQVCTQPVACCLSDGSCLMVDPLCCDELGGQPQEAGTTCGKPVAVCMPDGSCVMADPLCADELGGAVQGPGTTCELTGACCFTDGSCIETTRACCILAEGAYFGDGTLCLGDSNMNGVDDLCEFVCGGCPGDMDRSGGFDQNDIPGFVHSLVPGFPDPCADMNHDGILNGLDIQVFVNALLGLVDPCMPLPLGACCIWQGGCSLDTQMGCKAGGGSYLGDGTTCTVEGQLCP